MKLSNLLKEDGRNEWLQIAPKLLPPNSKEISDLTKLLSFVPLNDLQKDALYKAINKVAAAVISRREQYD